MTFLTVVLVSVYFVFSCLLLLHSVLQFWLARNALAGSCSVTPCLWKENSNFQLPKVTVQLPVYNECHIVKRLLVRVAALQYPRNLLQIQILDDSTDETTEIIATKVQELRLSGLHIEHIHRARRDGYKAGALRDGFQSAHGEFIAIFDADFLPSQDFLLQTIPWFNNADIGVVQTGWSYINEDCSMVTRLQGLGLNTHFNIEQFGRNLQGFFITFNGSAGVWRSSAIRDSGGWNQYTLAEDLDLSYRAQLRGWKFIFLPNIKTPAELPECTGPLRTQQFRWMKGLAQNTKVHVPSILHSDLPVSIKLHACAHLFESSLYIAILGIPLLTVPLSICWQHGLVGKWVFFNPLFVLSFILMSYVYLVSHEINGRGSRIRYFGLWLLFFIFQMGLSVHNTMAVLDGYIHQGGEFHRTLKRGNAMLRLNSAFSRTIAAEVVVCALMLASIVNAIAHGFIHLLWLTTVATAGLIAVLATLAVNWRVEARQ